MPFVNGSSLSVFIDGVELGKSTSATLAVNSNLADATSKDSQGWAENIYSTRSATLTVQALTAYDESVNFESLTDLMLNKTLLGWRFSNSSNIVSGAGYITDIEEVADMESAVRYDVEIKVTLAISENADFLLLETGDYLLLENNSRIILEELSATAQKQLTLPLNEGNGDPNYSGFQSGDLDLNGTIWSQDAIQGNYLRFFKGNNNTYLGSIFGANSINLPTKYRIDIRIKVTTNPTGTSTDRYRTILKSPSNPFLVLGPNQSIHVLHDGAVSTVNLLPVWASSFGTSLFSLNTWFKISLTVDSNLNEITCAVNNASVGGTISTINGGISNFTQISVIGKARASSFPETLDGDIASVFIQDLT